MILVELSGGSTIGGPCPYKKSHVACGARIDQARGPDGKLWCSSANGQASNWCAKCGTYVTWENGEWQVAEDRSVTRPTPASSQGKAVSQVLPPKVLSWTCSEDLVDADNICMDSWSEDSPLPVFYVGAWCDGLDFLGTSHHMAVDQRHNPHRHSFVFSFVPDTLADVKKAIIEWAQ